jgi:hypothetical protein
LPLTARRTEVVDGMSRSLGSPLTRPSMHAPASKEWNYAKQLSRCRVVVRSWSKLMELRATHS